MRFRGYRPTDIEAMFRLDAACFEPSFQFDRAIMQDLAERPEAIVVLAEEDTSLALAGFVIVHLENAQSDGESQIHGYVVTIDVAPGQRRTGTGAALLQQAERKSHSARAVRIGLHVSIGNTGAIKFYESLQYKQLGVAKRFYREAQQDALVFAKDL